MIAPISRTETNEREQLSLAREHCGHARAILADLTREAGALSNVRRLESTRSIDTLQKLIEACSGDKWLTEKVWLGVANIYINKGTIFPPALPILLASEGASQEQLEANQKFVASIGRLVEYSLPGALAWLRENLVIDIEKQVDRSGVRNAIAALGATLVQLLPVVEGTPMAERIEDCRRGLEVFALGDSRFLGKPGISSLLEQQLTAAERIFDDIESAVKVAGEQPEIQHSLCHGSEVKQDSAGLLPSCSTDGLSMLDPVAASATPGLGEHQPPVQLTPVSLRLLRIFSATLQPELETQDLSDVCAGVREVLGRELNLLTAKAVLADLARLPEGADKTVDTFRSFVKERVQVSERELIISCVAPLLLPEPLKTELIDHLVRAKIPEGQVESMVQAICHDSKGAPEFAASVIEVMLAKANRLVEGPCRISHQGTWEIPENLDELLDLTTFQLKDDSPPRSDSTLKVAYSVNDRESVSALMSREELDRIEQHLTNFFQAVALDMYRRGDTTFCMHCDQAELKEYRFSMVKISDGLANSLQLSIDRVDPPRKLKGDEAAVTMSSVFTPQNAAAVSGIRSQLVQLLEGLKYEAPEALQICNRLMLRYAVELEDFARASCVSNGLVTQVGRCIRNYKQLHEARLPGLNDLAWDAIRAESERLKHDLDAALRSKELSLLDPLKLPDHLKSEFAMKLEQEGMKSDHIRAIVEAIPTKYAGEVVERVIARAGLEIKEPVLTPKVAATLSQRFGNLMKLFKHWSYEPDEAKLICRDLLLSLVWNEERLDTLLLGFKELKTSAGKCISRFTELNDRRCPSSEDSNWIRVHAWREELGKELKAFNNQVRVELSDLGVGADAQNLLIRVHRRRRRTDSLANEETPQIKETLERIKSLRKQFARELWHQSGATKKLDPTKIGPGYWIQVAKMPRQEWSAYQKQLESLGEIAKNLPATIFNSICEGDIRTIKSIKDIPWKAQSGSAQQAVSSLVPQSTEDRVRFALDWLGVFDEVEPANTEILDGCVHLVRVLSEKHGRVSRQVLGKIVFKNKDIEGIDEVYRLLSHMTIIDTSSKDLVILLGGVHEILDAALHPTLTNEAFFERYMK
jgi:hypothetical protein